MYLTKLGGNPLARWMLGVGVLVAIAVAPTAAARASHSGHVTGDEPQYLLTAISLGEDLDLDIADERAEERWRPFHDGGPPQVQTELLEDGRRVSPHDPLLPALLALPVRVGGWLAAKFTLALLAGVLAAATTWFAVRRLAVREPVAAGVATLFGISAPLGIYGTQVYPELPAALLVLAGLGAVTGSPSARTSIVAVIAVVGLPWLSVKYVAVAAVLAGVMAARLLRSDERWLAGLFVSALAVAGGTYLLAHQVLYGGWTVYAAGDHFVSGGELSVVGHDPDYAGRSGRLIGLLVDRGFGLAAWQPAYLLAVPALAAMIRRRPRGWIPLILVLAAGWLTATFVALTMHGWWWPGRQTVVVLPTVVLAVAWWVDRHVGRQIVLALAGGAGLVMIGWLLVEVVTGGVTLIVDFEAAANPLYGAWRTVLPDYRSPDATTWALHGTWIAAAVGAAWWAWRDDAPRPTERRGEVYPTTSVKVPEGV